MPLPRRVRCRASYKEVQQQCSSVQPYAVVLRMVLMLHFTVDVAQICSTIAADVEGWAVAGTEMRSVLRAKCGVG